MNRVVAILMERDGLTEKQAMKRVAETSAQIQDALAYEAFEAIEDIVASELGLEMDYIEDILEF